MSPVEDQPVGAEGRMRHPPTRAAVTTPTGGLLVEAPSSGRGAELVEPSVGEGVLFGELAGQPVEDSDHSPTPSDQSRAWSWSSWGESETGAGGSRQLPFLSHEEIEPLGSITATMARRAFAANDGGST